MTEAEIKKKCTEIFGDQANAWLKSPIQALDGKTPDELMRSEEGKSLVWQELGRIEHGLVS